MIGNIIKIHSNFYYVSVADRVMECKVREKIKKEKIDVLVGDFVRVEEVGINSGEGVITEVLERKNHIKRPAIANIDQVIIISAINQPHLDFVQLNRFLTLAELNNIQPIICINKFDLEDIDNIQTKMDKVYKHLGYKTIFTSAIENYGIDNLKTILKDKKSVFCGISGVGKSTLLNKLVANANLRTGEVSLKNDKGTHTTRHVELLQLKDIENTFVADSPGFSYLKFDNILPYEINSFFPEIKELATGCKFSNCLHTHESDCNVIANIKNIDTTRYESYRIFIEEALEYKEKLYQSGHKVEKKTKVKDSNQSEKIKLVKFSAEAREKSRKQKNQKLNQLNRLSTIDDSYYNIDSDLF